MQYDIDQRALEAHAWLTGYSAGASGQDYHEDENFAAVLDAHRRGWEAGRSLYTRPVKR